MARAGQRAGPANTPLAAAMGAQTPGQPVIPEAERTTGTTGIF